MEIRKNGAPCPALFITYKPTVDLQPSTHNARTHTKRQIRQIGNSIVEFGFINPILVDNDNRVVAGHGRLAAAHQLGIEQVPTVRIEHLTPDQIRGCIVADNRLAELAGWDQEILAIELKYLCTLDDVLDVTVTGFEVPEIDQILEVSGESEDPEDELPEIPQEPAVTESGDLWLLGKHRLLCGNALERGSFDRLPERRRAMAVISDPPYNVRIDGHATGNGAVHHREFAMASGEMSNLEFVSFLINVLRLFSAFSTPESLHYIFIDWRHLYELLSAGRQTYDALLNLCVWAKNAGGMGSFYRSRHELIAVYRNGKGGQRNNVQLGKFGRDRTNVWEYPNVHTQSKQGEEGNLLALHPTVKPVALVADALLDCSARGDIVLDSFLGSGSTLLAAERVGRVCYGIEIDPLYVDVAIRRWQRHTGDRAIHATTGKAFDEVAALSEGSHA